MAVRVNPILEILADALLRTCLITDAYDGARYCRLCGVCQNHATQNHADDCPAALAQRLISA